MSIQTAGSHLDPYRRFWEGIRGIAPELQSAGCKRLANPSGRHCANSNLHSKTGLAKFAEKRGLNLGLGSPKAVKYKVWYDLYQILETSLGRPGAERALAT